MNVFKKILAGLLFMLSVNAHAYNFPLCSNNQVDDLSIGNVNVPWHVYICYTTPSSFKVKINKISLIKTDNTVVDFYSPSTPEYIDLTQGISDLAQNITPVSGTYQALRMDVDPHWKITASADYTPSSWTPSRGPTEYCRTKASSNSNFGNTSLTGDGHGSWLEGSNVSAGETLFKHNAFNFVTPGANGTDNQQDQYATYPYFSKMTYAINSSEVSRIEHYFVNGSGGLELNSNNITGAYIDVYFTNPITINSDTDLSYTLNIDLTKGVGFAFDMSTDGGATIQDDNKCNFMTVGPLEITLTVQ